MDNKKKKATNRDGTLASLIWKFGERITAQLVSTVVSIILARILYPEDYGIVSVVTILITLCNAFVTGGLGNALIQKPKADELDFSSVFHASMMLSALMYLIVFACASPIAKLYGDKRLIWIIRVMAFRIPIAAINSVQHAYLSRKMQFKKFFIATLFGTVLSAFVGITLALNGFGAWALVGQYLTNVCAGTIVLFFVGGWRPHLMFSWNRLKNMLPYGLKIMSASLLDTGFSELRSLIISIKYSVTDLAMYDNGRKYPNLMVTNINTSIGSVMFPVMSKAQRQNIKYIMKNSVKVSTFALAPLLLGFAAVANRFVTVVLTDKWLECVPYIWITCIMCLFYPVHTINIQALNAIGESGRTLKLEIIKKVVNIIVLLVSMFYGVIAIAIGAMIVSLVSTYINAFYSKRIFGYSFIEQMHDIVPSLTLATAMMGVVMFLDNIIKLNGWLTLSLDIIFGGIFYIVLSYVFKFPELNILFKKAKQYLKTLQMRIGK